MKVKIFSTCQADKLVDIEEKINRWMENTYPYKISKTEIVKDYIFIYYE